MVADPLAPSIELPAAFRERMRSLLGDDADAFLESLRAPPVRGVRAHPGRMSLASIAAATGWTMTALPWAREAGVLDANVIGAGKHPLHELGAFYLQDPAATLPAIALDPRPGETIADLAAAPGGKATALAAALGDHGTLLANDIDAERVGTLAKNLERFGAPRTLVTRAAPAELAARLPATFDAVLLDAPCSGEGMFRKSSAAREQWSPSAVAYCAHRQADLLDAAVELLKPGGRLVYATCTFAPEENEGVIADLIRRRDDVAPLRLALPGTSPGHPEWVGAADVLPADAVARVWPHRHPGDGHVVTSLQRLASALPKVAGVQPAPRPPRRPKKQSRFTPVDRATREAWRAFVLDTLTPDVAVRFPDEALVESGGLAWRSVDVPWLARLADLQVLRPGLALGAQRGGRWTPAHALAGSLRTGEALREVELDLHGPALARWLAGEELDVDDAGVAMHGVSADGHALVTTSGVPAGWAKRSGRRLRNLVPRGLRRRA